MRPERLTIEGFAPFRDRIEVDFSGLDLFALTGPTGAGKSSVIDALVFALYGSVPRHGKKSISPVISLGKAQTTVGFDFRIDGRPYTVVRKVQRNTKGGVASEARLESDGDVLASGAEVTQAVEALLGLGIDHFTRSVVLPQGEFAAFLHDTPAGQQDLVKALLDMGVLDTVRKLATERAKTAGALAERAKVALEALEEVTPEAVAACSQRLATLEELVEPVAEAEQSISRAETFVKERNDEVERVERLARLVGSISVPEDVAVVADELETLQSALADAQQECAAAEADLRALEKTSEALPSRTDLESAQQVIGRLEEARRRRDDLAIEDLEQAAQVALEEWQAAVQSHERSQADLESVRDRHTAHALAAGLAEGDECPVCSRPLDEAPKIQVPDLEEKQAAVRAAADARQLADERRKVAETALTEARASRRALDETIAELEERLAGLPVSDDLADQLAARSELDSELSTARSRLEGARESLDKARASLAEREQSAARAWERFGEMRDRLAALEPPPPPRDDLRKAWDELSGWAAGMAEKLTEQLIEARDVADRARVALEEQRADLERLLGEAGVEGNGSASARVAVAVAEAKAALDRLQERMEEKRSLEADSAEFSKQAAVASSLGNHLRANRFEAWLLAEALATLVEGANELLDDLTASAYSLALSGQTIEVVDHRNADELRSVKSLSGGETFLVSLALALSLGEQLTTVADKQAARLEAIFLDEGFGSLDAETLETVTVVVTELAAQGRMVGIVTHVKELAEQMPVRFEVRPGPDGSSIEKVAV